MVKWDSSQIDQFPTKLEYLVESIVILDPTKLEHLVESTLTLDAMHITMAKEVTSHHN